MKPRESRALTGELMMFIADQQLARGASFITDIVKMLEAARIEVLLVRALAAAEAASLKAHWSANPPATLGSRAASGEPHTLLICYDWYPKPAEESGAKPVNTKTSVLLKKARKIQPSRLWFWRRGNTLWAPAGEAQILQSLEIVDPGLMQRCRDWSLDRQERFRSEHDIIEVLSEGRRSRTDLIRFSGGKAIQKTFRIGFENQCLNELRARELFAAEVSMPKIYGHSSARIFVEYLSDVNFLRLETFTAAEKHRVAEAIVAWFYAFWSKGYFTADFGPRNIMRDSSGKLTMIDFEFLQPYRGEKPPFEKAFEFDGVPRGAGYLAPNTPRPKSVKYHSNWNAMPFGKYFRPAIDRVLGNAAVQR